MSHLFTISNKVVFPNPETLLISPFKDIWERDKTKEKAFALEDLTYVEFTTSMFKSNPYREYPESRKHEVVMKDIITRKGWKVDPLITKAQKKIKDLQEDGSTTYNYYMSAKLALEKLQEFFNTFDINERNPKTFTPIHKPREITSAVKDTKDALLNLKALDSQMQDEMMADTKTRGNKEIGYFANPDSLNG